MNTTFENLPFSFAPWCVGQAVRLSDIEFKVEATLRTMLIYGEAAFEMNDEELREAVAEAMEINPDPQRMLEWIQ